MLESNQRINTDSPRKEQGIDISFENIKYEVQV